MKYSCMHINNKRYQKKIIDTFLNSIYVYDDKLVLTYNYKDGTETVSFKEVENTIHSDVENARLPTTQKDGFVPSFCVSDEAGIGAPNPEGRKGPADLPHFHRFVAQMRCVTVFS